MGRQYEALRERLGTVRNLQKVSSVLTWDQETKMPPGGAHARAEALATLSRISHTMFTAPETEELLLAAAEDTRDLPYDDDRTSLVRVAQRDYDRSKRVPADLVAELARHGALAHEIWVQARRTNDYAAFAPCLETTLDLSRRRADFLGYTENRYDALLDLYEPGMTASQVQNIFERLKQELVPVVSAIGERADRVTDAPVHAEFDERKQEEFGEMVAAALGYDFSRGRQDRAVHPFETAFS